MINSVRGRRAIPIPFRSDSVPHRFARVYPALDFVIVVVDVSRLISALRLIAAKYKAQTNGTCKRRISDSGGKEREEKRKARLKVLIEFESQLEKRLHRV